MRRRLWFALIGFVWLSGCAEDRTRHAIDLAAPAGLRFRTVETASFEMAAWVRLADPRAPVTVYIEGDGAAYGADGHPSLDPTPRRALALALAARDPAANVVYLARPCQYVRDPRCRPADWAAGRFSETAVAAVSDALDSLVPRAAAIHLVGYSGGAAIAVRIAARRPGVLSLRTVAGNLDPYGVNRLHHATEHLSALDPLVVAPRLAAVPQRHFIGNEDKVVPSSVAYGFVKAEGGRACASVTEVRASHETGWEARWPQLLALPLPDCGRE